MRGAEVVVDTSVDVLAQLTSCGYAIVRGAAYRLSGLARAELGRLHDSYCNLPIDRYLTDGGRYRHRRYGAFRVSPDTITARPNRPYYQPIEVNRFAGGMARELAPLDPQQQRNSFLTALLRCNVGKLPEAGEADWEVDVHLVRVTATAADAGRPSPEGVHRDGFDYISIHLLALAGPATGGMSKVVLPEGAPVAWTRLTHRLDSLYLNDRALLHDVTPLVVTTGRAHRDVLLMSYRRPGG